VTEQTDPTKRPVTAEEWNAKFLREGIARIAADLRRLAEEVERTTVGIDRIGRPGRDNYGQVAAEVDHVVSWGFANLKTESLIRSATDADIARAKGE
jgi:hypothetical protein